MNIMVGQIYNGVRSSEFGHTYEVRGISHNSYYDTIIDIVGNRTYAILETCNYEKHHDCPICSKDSERWHIKFRAGQIGEFFFKFFETLELDSIKTFKNMKRREEDRIDEQSK